MIKFVRKILFLCILFISFSFQSLIPQDFFPQTTPIEKAAFERLKDKTKGTQDELLQFTVKGHVLGFGKKNMIIATGDHALRIEFLNAKPVFPENLGTFPDMGKNLLKTDSLGKITYADLWDGITLVYERHDSGLIKSTYTVQPGQVCSSNPVDQIRLRYNVPVEVDVNGNLVFHFEKGQMKESRPVAWQEIRRNKIPVDVSFCLFDEQEVGFEVESYDPRYPLVIDPVLSWNTFLGSMWEDTAKAIAVDGSGNIYIAGDSKLTWGTPINPHSGINQFDIFVAKLNSSGELQWHTFMGGLSDDLCRDMSLDGNGNIYVVGDSNATWGAPVNAFTSNDVVAVKLNSSGVLQWNTFMGAGGAQSSDQGHGIAVDGSGNVYVVGGSEGPWGTPINPFNQYNEYWDAFVVKLNSSGERQWLTFMGSTDDEVGHGIAVNGGGNVYVVGESGATWGTPVNPFTGTENSDVFVAKLNTSGERQWNTFMGSTEYDEGFAIAVDGSESSYVVGDSSASWGTPINAHTGGSEPDAFVAKLDVNGNRQWNTFMGSTNADRGFGVAVDTTGNVYVTGMSELTWGTPINAHAGGGPPDAFAAKFNSSGERQWNAFMGSTDEDTGNGIAVDGIGSVYVVGESMASWGSPIRAYSGGRDAFVVKIPGMNIYVFDGHDFTGNGESDVSVFRPSNGRWYIKGIPSSVWGKSGDIPVNGDYNGDGTTDVAIWRPSNGRWYIKDIGGVVWGASGDIPVPGNYDGDVDGTTDIAVWRPSNGRWYISGVGGSIWGTEGDIPVPGDYNGDGMTEIAVWRPSNGRWYIKGVGGSVWGMDGDIPVPGDYNGDGTTDIAVWRPSNGKWYIKGVSASIWGTAGDIPAPGDYNGDGIADIAIWRPSNGRWYIKGIGNYIWGMLGDIPLVR
jgi:hypothetical protein